MRDAEEAPGRGLQRRAAHVDLRGERGGQLGLPDARQRLGDRRVRRRGSPARWSSCRRRCRRSRRAAGAAGRPRPAPSARAASRRRPAAARRAGRRRRRAPSPRGRRRRAPPRARRGSRPGRPRAAPRGRRRASRRRARRRPRARRLADSSCSTVARSAALSFSKVASRLAAPWPLSSICRPPTSRHSTVIASPRRRRPLPGRRTNSRVTSQSRVRCCSIADVPTTAAESSSSSVTVRSSSSPSTSVSVGRCSKRRMLTRPVVMTWPASMEVTRVIGTKIRRRPGTSTTRPRTRGASWPMRSETTTSRTRPTWSPVGSNTAMPARRAMKTLRRRAAHEGSGYRRAAPEPRYDGPGTPTFRVRGSGGGRGGRR